MIRKLFAGILGLALCGSLTSPILPDASFAAAPPAPTGEASACQALLQTDLSGIEDAPTTIMWTREKAADADLPGHCEVRGYATPNIGFLAWLPTKDWNGKFLQGGCGGTCGTLEGIAQCRDPLRRGYACIVSDGGHQSTPVEMKWSYNRPELMVDYYVRTPHIAALVGKALVETFYKAKPKRSYFLGCSSGGSQALNAAQRFPWDYDGIVSISPAPSVTDTQLTYIWGNQSLYAKDGTAIFPQDKLELLHNAVIARCEMNDGLKDGLIGDPRQCAFRPEEIQCRKGQSGQCLSAAQVTAANRLYDGPRTPDGQQLAPAQSLKGSELYWPSYAPILGGPSDFIADWFRYYAFQPNPGPKWRIGDFDFAHDYTRIGAGAITDANNPDLTRLRDAGGKLLLVSGWDDAMVSVPRLAEYYEKTERLMGGRAATLPFFRAFFSPGMSHCGAGEGANVIDYLSAIENWVEKGEAPEKLTAYHIDNQWHEWDYESYKHAPSRARFSRPVYPYPIEARYLGHGDPTRASSFGPASAAD